MNPTPNNDCCPRCGEELETKDEVLVGDEAWLRENVPYDESEWDTLREDYVYVCPNCTYRYP